jgi:hypothetical protein
MNRSAADQKRVTKYAIWGAVILGILGFTTGAVICLHFHLPIPPLFITEMGILVGGCMGALCALTRTERKVLPSLMALSGALLLGLGFGLDWIHVLGAALALFVVIWNTIDTAGQETATWRNL